MGLLVSHVSVMAAMSGLCFQIIQFSAAAFDVLRKLRAFQVNMKVSFLVSSMQICFDFSDSDIFLKDSLFVFAIVQIIH